MIRKKSDTETYKIPFLDMRQHDSTTVHSFVVLSCCRAVVLSCCRISIFNFSNFIVRHFKVYVYMCTTVCLRLFCRSKRRKIWGKGLFCRRTRRKIWGKGLFCRRTRRIGVVLSCWRGRRLSCCRGRQHDSTTWHKLATIEWRLFLR